MDTDTHMKDIEEVEKDEIDDEILQASTQEIDNRRYLLDNDVKIMKLEHRRLGMEKLSLTERIKDNREKIENNRYDLQAFERIFIFKLVLMIIY